MLSRAGLVRTDELVECIASIIRATRIVLRLPVTTNVVHSSLILVTLMMEAMHSSETSFLTRATRRKEDGILHSHCSETLKSYIALRGLAL
jgi:hypothetical protein